MAEDFLQDLREDVEFDGMDSQMDYEFKGNLLKIDCNFE
jgi:frataxin-like iron-binding protein CyaY